LRFGGDDAPRKGREKRGVTALAAGSDAGSVGPVNVLVTGGAGYLGSALASQLLASGHRVRLLDALLHGGEAVLPLYHSEGFEFQRGDVRNAADISRSLEGIDAVVHLAAIVGDPACRRDPNLAEATNHAASLALFARAQRSAKRFVFASTCSNYGRRDDESFVTEEASLSSLSVYAETKVATELDLLAASAEPDAPSVTVLRFATLFGLSGRARFDLTVNEFAAVLQKLEVYGEQFWRRYIHVADAARAVRLVLEAPTRARAPRCSTQAIPS
jgi:nucleoside-diphosphate-sugar epimerase